MPAPIRVQEIVTVILGSFKERERLTQSRLKAMALLEQTKSEATAEKPKGPCKAKAASPGPNDCPASAPALQCSTEPGKEQDRRDTTTNGCPGCGGKDYVFRGRKLIKADPAKGTGT